jgi:hypothetical protein
MALDFCIPADRPGFFPPIIFPPRQLGLLEFPPHARLSWLPVFTHLLVLSGTLLWSPLVPNPFFLQEGIQVPFLQEAFAATFQQSLEPLLISQ